MFWIAFPGALLPDVRVVTVDVRSQGVVARFVLPDGNVTGDVGNAFERVIEAIRKQNIQTLIIGIKT